VCGRRLDKGPKGLLCKRLLLGRFVLLIINIRLFKTVILPVVLCGCGNWSIRLKDLRVFENRVLWGYFGVRRNR